MIASRDSYDARMGLVLSGKCGVTTRMGHARSPGCSGVRRAILSAGYSLGSLDFTWHAEYLRLFVFRNLNKCRHGTIPATS
jgi:hypothetical protein